MTIIKYLSIGVIWISFLPFLIFLTSGCSHSKSLSQNSRDELYPKKNAVVRYHNDWTRKNYTARIEQFKKDTLNFGDIIFLGNSITELGMDWNAKFGIQHIHNRGIAGDVTDGVLIRLKEIIYCKPMSVFLLIGINDLYNLHDTKEIPSVGYVGNNIVEIAKKIHKGSPRTQIYIQMILPTSKEYLKESIKTVNGIIKLNEQYGIYEVIDLHSQFINEQGLMREELTSDGTHLNESGYKVWTSFIKPFVVLK